MSDEPNFGLSADRIRQLLECKPAEGYKMPRWEDKVKATKPKRVLKMTKQAIYNRIASAKWRAANRELHRKRVSACMKKRREKMKVNGEKVR